MSALPKIWRKPVSWNTLDCGHHLNRKPSAKTPKKSRCKDCEELRGGTRVTFWPDLRIKEVWDAATQMPKRVPMEPGDYK